MGWPEILMIGMVGVIVFGPDKLPDLARQAGRFIRTVRRMAENAKNDLGREIGEDFSGLKLRDLDPREMVRKNILDTDDDSPGVPQQTRELRPDERPPFDPDST
ncbi:sec-independent translocase [Aeromicrobium sp.]|uniref:sec-independent translocase n=1 Tax=Aeromicrobium sp. TaxID=1871063 RepID=UPI003C6B57E4